MLSVYKVWASIPAPKQNKIKQNQAELDPAHKPRFATVSLVALLESMYGSSFLSN